MAAEHNYFAADGKVRTAGDVEPEDETDSASEGEAELIPTLPESIVMDHSYCQPYHPVDPQAKELAAFSTIISSQEENSRPDPTANVPVVISTVEVEISDAKPQTPVKDSKPRARKRSAKLTDVTNLDTPLQIPGSRELAGLFTPPPPKLRFNPRGRQEEMQITYSFLLQGIDQEDTCFLKRCYEELLQADNPSTYWLNDSHWMNHPHTLIPDPPPPRKRRKYGAQDDLPMPHKTGMDNFPWALHVYQGYRFLL